MASHLDAVDEPLEHVTTEDVDRIDVHLLSALDSTEDDDRARYHLREALQLQLAEMHGHS